MSRGFFWDHGQSKAHAAHTYPCLMRCMKLLSVTVVGYMALGEPRPPRQHPIQPSDDRAGLKYLQSLDTPYLIYPHTTNQAESMV